MSCYLRHLKEVFEQAGIALVTTEDRKRADRMVHELVGAGDKECPRAWALVKARLAEDREGFIDELRKRWNR
jgi:hypothetical protein